MDKTKTYEAASDYGALHDADCCVHTGECDVTVALLDCCDNMRMVKNIIDEAVEHTVECISHDMHARDEDQRKAIVDAYLLRREFGPSSS